MARINSVGNKGCVSLLLASSVVAGDFVSFDIYLIKQA